MDNENRNSQKDVKTKKDNKTDKQTDKKNIGNKEEEEE